MVTRQDLVARIQQIVLTITLPEPRIAGTMPSWRYYGLIPVRKKDRGYFAGFRIPVIFRTDIGDIETEGTSADNGIPIGDRTRWKYFARGLRPWYVVHPEIVPGDKVRFEMIDPYRIYRARFIHI